MAASDFLAEFCDSSMKRLIVVVVAVLYSSVSVCIAVNVRRSHSYQTTPCVGLLFDIAIWRQQYQWRWPRAAAANKIRENKAPLHTEDKYANSSMISLILFKFEKKDLSIMDRKWWCLASIVCGFQFKRKTQTYVTLSHSSSGISAESGATQPIWMGIYPRVKGWRIDSKYCERRNGTIWQGDSRHSIQSPFQKYYISAKLVIGG